MSSRPSTRRVLVPLSTTVALLALAFLWLLDGASSPTPTAMSRRAPGHDEILTTGDPSTHPEDGAPPALDETDPTVARLDPDLLDALRGAWAEAAGAGISIRVTSGWRSRADQDRLLREAVLEYGSLEEAARWVATPDTSPHVSGDAVDIGPWDAMTWLAEHGAAYGLCRIYANEPWHYELVPEALDTGCPALYADPTHDPRMRR